MDFTAKLARENFCFFVGQRNGAGHASAILKDPPMGVAVDFAVVAFDLYMPERMVCGDGQVVFVGQAATGGDFKVVIKLVVVWQ